MRKILKPFFLALLTLSVFGCQSIVRTDISTFRDENARSAIGSIRIAPMSFAAVADSEYEERKIGAGGDADASQDKKNETESNSAQSVAKKVDSNSLEFIYYKDKLANRLRSAGYTLSDADSSEYLASFTYGVIRQEKDEPSSRVVIGGHFGHYLHYPHSPIFLSDVDNPKFEYVRELSFSIERMGDSPKKIMQIKATSTGRCEHLTIVYDEMLDAIFSDLYRASGSVEKVSIAGDARCP